MALAPSDLPKEAACIAPIPVPTYGAGGNFTVACTTEIAGSALSCLEKVLDLPHYGTWNTFIPRAEVLLKPGPTDQTSSSHDAPKLPPEVQALISRPGFISPGARIKFEAVMSGSSSRSVELEVSFLETFTPNEHEAGDGDGDGHPIGDAKGTRTTINGTAYRVAWKGTFTPGFMLRSERVQEFVEYVAADGSVWTRYSNWETFGGLLGYVLPREQIVAGFQKWTTGLKEAVEGEGQQGK
ncbi:hypothetical protein F5Y08DRAFT_197485 [Xylaria arbuscula]|nr:hypothetical protein F5Y08DRAFT_197485 [Xylaria arbuscula]